MKKLLAFILAALMVCLMTVPAMATTTIVADRGNGSTQLSYSVTQTYTVTIPEGFDLSTTESPQVLSVSNVLIPDGKKLTVNMVSTNFDSTDKYRVAYQGSYIKYSVKVGSSETALAANDTEILALVAGTTSGSVTLKFQTTAGNIAGATKAGIHTDTLTFNFAVVSIT